MRYQNIEVTKVCYKKQNQYAELYIRFTALTNATDETYYAMTNGGIVCDTNVESNLMRSFFCGFGETLSSRYSNLPYKLEVLCHWYHDVDSSEFSYRQAGRIAAEWFNENPEVFGVVNSVQINSDRPENE